MNHELRDLRGRIEKLRQELADIIKQAGSDMDMSKVTVIDGDSATKVAYMKAINAELDEAMKKAEPLERDQAALIRSQEQLKKFGEPLTDHPGFPIGDRDDMWTPSGGKSIGQAFTEAWNANGRQKDKSFSIDIGAQPVKSTLAQEFKTTMTEAAGWAPQAIRTGQMIPYATRPIQLIDIMPSGTTDQQAVVYMTETTFTPAATEALESSVYAEAALAYTEINAPTRKIAVFIPVTDEQLADVGQIQSILNQRLPFFVRQRLDYQILNGTGTAPQLQGIISGSVANLQTQAKSTDPAPDAIYKAIVKVRITGRANPNVIVMHATDYQNVRLLRTADGIYIWGNPSEMGDVQRMWGLPVVIMDSGAQGTALVGDFAGFSQLVERKGLEVKISDSHSDFFIKGIQAIRCDYRCALVWYRGAAFCQVTGL